MPPVKTFTAPALVLAVWMSFVAAPASWEAQSSGVTARLRGVSAVSERVAWASGAGGTVVRTADGGKTWVRLSVPDADKLDFRDVDAVSATTAYILSIGSGAASRIYSTADAGASWQLQFTNEDPRGFFDAMAFWDAQRGIVKEARQGSFPLGDLGREEPVGGRLDDLDVHTHRRSHHRQAASHGLQRR